MRARGAPAVLDRRTLNRTLLERQMLLDRRRLGTATAVEHLVGLQAQEPQAPYVGLWSRIEGFIPESLSELLATRAAVRGLLMRSTLHLVTATDWSALRAITQEVNARGFRGSAFSKALVGVDIEEVLEHGRELLAERPLTRAELKVRLAERWPHLDPDPASYAITYLEPIVQVPPRGLWRSSGAPRWAATHAWLGRTPNAEPDPATLMVRYLKAFGPASVADFQAWSGLSKQARVATGLQDRVRGYRDEDGHELLDLADASLANPAEAAPVRFLAPFDSAILGHAGRSRIIAPADRDVVYRDRLMRTFLVDGFVAGTWRLNEETLRVQPLRPLRASDSRAVIEEAERLLAFLLPVAAAPAVRLEESP